MPKPESFHYKERCELENYIKEGYSIKKIAEIFKVSRTTIYTELHRGGYSGKKNKDYSAQKAQMGL